MDAPAQTEYMTISEFARRFQLHEESVREWARTGRIPGAVRVGRSWRIKRTDVARAELRGVILAD